MRRTLLFSLLLLVLFLPPLVFAQGPERIAGLNVSVWPEYDEPGVLVIMDGEFADKAGFPREVAFLIPADARVNATAYSDGKGNYLNTDPWKTQDAGNGLARLLFNLPAPAFHLEYYYNPLQGAPNKTMDFGFTAAHAIDKVQVEVQEPLKSSNFKTNPVAIMQTTRGHEFKYHVLQFPALAAGQTLKVQVSYTRSDPNPSVAYIAPPQTQGEPSAAASSNNLILPIALAATGLALATLGFFAWRARRAQEEASGEPMPRPRRKKKPHAAAAFCHECGNALSAEDVFCSKCGARKKSSG